MLDRDAAVAAWRRAEGRIYPSVMLNATLYQEYVAVIKGIAEELGDVRSEDDLVARVARAPRPRPRGDRPHSLRRWPSS